MKKTTLVIAAFLLALSTISVSCKKQDDSAENRKENSPKPFYRPPKVDDMNAYLEGFIQKMKTRGTEESTY